MPVTNHTMSQAYCRGLGRARYWVLCMCLLVCVTVSAQDPDSGLQNAQVNATVTTVQVKGQAAVEKGDRVAARKRAIDDAMAQAALQRNAVVQSRSDLQDHALVTDRVSVRSTASVRNTRVVDEWVDEPNQIYNVIIQAQVVDAPGISGVSDVGGVEGIGGTTVLGEEMSVFGAQPSSATVALLKRSLAVTQFQVPDRVQIHDMPDLETLLAQELLKRLERTGSVLAVDATPYLLSASSQPFADLGQNQEQIIAQLARELGVQFILSGTVRDMGKTAHALFTSLRHVELEVQLWDGISGMRLQSHRFNASVWVDRPFDFPLSTPVMADKFFASPVGQEINKILKQLVASVYEDLQQLPFSTRVVNVKGKTVYIDSGAMAAVKPGDRFTAYRQGIDVFRSRAGHWLGMQESPTATVLIKSVQPGFSIGEIQGKGKSLISGDILRFTPD